MKVAVITRHAITNYGSLLQAMATQKVIENLGYACEIIDYVRYDESYREHEKTLLKRKPEWNNNAFKRIVYLMLRQPESVLSGKKFEKARTQCLNLTKSYDSLRKLESCKPIADVYMTGSDQVWGPTEDGSYDSAYCLSFTGEMDKKVAYAASFGHANMSSNLKEYYTKWLGRYAHITVREDSAVEMLENIGIRATQVIDPTLILDASYWDSIAEPIKMDKYVLVYQLHNDKRVGVYAEKVAKKRGLPLIRISSSLHQITRQGKFIWCPSVGEFLSYIKNAECMVTDSFHGTAFAITFNTPFIEVLPPNNTNTRNQSILRMTGLLNQILFDDEDSNLPQLEPDFTYANKIIAQKRVDSLEVLKNIIEK